MAYEHDVYGSIHSVKGKRGSSDDEMRHTAKTVGHYGNASLPSVRKRNIFENSVGVGQEGKIKPARVDSLDSDGLNQRYGSIRDGYGLDSKSPDRAVQNTGSS